MNSNGTDATSDYQGRAVAAMKLAVAASGSERTTWVRVAQAWYEMARWVEHGDAASPAPAQPFTPRSD